MRFLVSAFFVLYPLILPAGTQDYVKCNVILVKPDVVYFNVGNSSGVAPGESFEIYYDEMVVASGKIEWADQYISRSEKLDQTTIAAIYFNDGLTAKINLFVPQANRGGFLSIPYLSDLNLEPSGISTPDEKTVGRLIHRGLLTRDIDGKIVPDLAGAFEVRGLTYTFYIDPGARFHSGKPVEATDVLYSIERLSLSPKLTPAGCFVLMIKGTDEFRHRVRNEISGIFLIDNKTISITLKEPFPSFEEYLAGPGGYIIPRPGLELPGGNVSGAGTYKIKWRNADGLTLEPFGEDNPAACLDSICFMKFGSLDEAALSFELGRLDVITTLGEPSPKFMSKGENTSMTGKTICSAVLGVNGLRDYQANMAFSRALAYLIDKETIIRVILGGAGRIPENLIFGYGEGAAAVYPDSATYYFESIDKLPATVNLYVDSHYPSLWNVSRYIAGQLQNKGIKVKEKKADLASLEEDRARTDIDLYLNYYSPVSSDPECVLYPLYSYELSGQTNYLYCKDEALQTFLSKLRSEVDQERREILAAGLLHSIAVEPPSVILYQPYLTTVLKADVSGIRPLDEGYLDLRGAFIEIGR